MDFDWDPSKDHINEKKHGISFGEAVMAFFDPFALVAHDALHSTPEEDRETLIGEAEPGVLVVVFTVRESGSIYRLISARRATRKERKTYEETKRISL